LNILEMSFGRNVYDTKNVIRYCNTQLEQIDKINRNYLQNEIIQWDRSK